MPRLPILLLFVFMALPALASEAEIRALLAERLPGVELTDLEPSTVPGLWEVRVGPRVFYVSPDGRYLINGKVLDLKTESDVTELSQRDARLDWMAAIDERRMIVFEPVGEADHTITVFTDIDCTYCRALHANIQRMQRDGIRVRYLFFPRSGPGTVSARKAEEVWCATDRRNALTRAKAGESVDSPDCADSPVMEHLNLGRALGVTGTPMIITDSGTIISGYLPPAQMLERLESDREQRLTRVSRPR